MVGLAGTGFWNRDRDEILLIGTRGNFVAPAMGTQPESVWFAARPRIDGASRGRHSAKPENAHLWIEQNWPSLPKIELNARGKRAGWDLWGYEAPPDDDPHTENDDVEISQQNQAPDENRPADRTSYENAMHFTGDGGKTVTRVAADGSTEILSGRELTALFDADRDLPECLRRKKGQTDVPN